MRTRLVQARVCFCEPRPAVLRALGVGLFLAAFAVSAHGQGACCMPNGSCMSAATEAQCSNLGGVFFAGVDCASNPCGLGACCAGGSCVQVNAYTCIVNGRDWAGAGVSCAENPCNFETGSCCVNGTCVQVLPSACASAGGVFIGFGNLCQQDPCHPGACCLPEGCTPLDRFHCTANGGTFYEDASCDEDPCAATTTCPPGTLFGQDRDGPTHFTAYASEDSAGFRRYENFAGLNGAITGLEWWGLDYNPNGAIPQDCTESDPTFSIAFYEDAAGVPGALLCTYTLTAAVTPTGVIYDDSELNQYDVSLPGSCAVVNGWVSIVGLGDPDCWFLWISAGAGVSYCDGCAVALESSDLALCILGEPGGARGACCMEETGQCSDDVDIRDCSQPGQIFHPGQTCGEISPPCGVIVGACCVPEAACSQQTQADCAVAGGQWLGPHTACSQCPCVVVCPAAGIPEGEPACHDDYVDTFNGGCTSSLQNFSSITLGQTICGTSGVFMSSRELTGDFDWFELNLARQTDLLWIVRAEFPVRAQMYDPQLGCDVLIPMLGDVAGACHDLRQEVTLPASSYWLVVVPAAATDSAQCGARYVMSVVARGVRGDMNCDGVVDNSDIDAFVLALIDPAGYMAGFPQCDIRNADVNQDGVVDNSDIDGFVECLLNGGCS